MNNHKFFYNDLPKLISAIRDLSSKRRVHSRGLSFQLLSDNWITKFRARTFNDKEPEMLDWLDENLQDGDIFFDVGGKYWDFFHLCSAAETESYGLRFRTGILKPASVEDEYN